MPAEPAVLRLILGTGRMVTPFLWQRAAQRGDPVLLELLWEHRASPEGGFDDWALTASLDANDTRALEWLLNKKADPNVRTPNGEAPLVVATLKGKSDHVMRLLDAGADRNFGYAHGYTALMAAISSSENELVELYLARGAAITASRDDGTTALHIAAGRGKQELMERLVEAGAKLDAMAEDGNTADDGLLQWTRRRCPVVAGRWRRPEARLSRGPHDPRRGRVVWQCSDGAISFERRGESR